MVNVAILGFGTVGSGVAEVLTTNGGLIDQRVETLVRLKYILDVRDFPDSPYRDMLRQGLLASSRATPRWTSWWRPSAAPRCALDFTTRALKAGKSVVTSNKELVATHGYELLQLAKEHGVSYLFEASVGGGIPILRPLTSCLAANELSQVTGILNGTTNYILTRMIKAGLTFEQALKEAQDNGYAERDPSADVDGHDACRKICILAALAFGQHVYPDQVPTQGIRSVTLADVAYADSCGYKIKLLGRAIREAEGKVCAFVAPHLVPASNPLSGVEDVFNAIAVTGNAIGDVMFYGRGAGKLPTASAVVADVIDIAKDLKTAPVCGLGTRVPGPGGQFRHPQLPLVCPGGRPPWTKSGPPSGRSASWPGRGAPAGETAFLTAPMTEPQVRARLEGMELHSLIRVLE